MLWNSSARPLDALRDGIIASPSCASGNYRSFFDKGRNSNFATAKIIEGDCG